MNIHQVKVGSTVRMYDAHCSSYYDVNISKVHPNDNRFEGVIINKTGTWGLNCQVGNVITDFIPTWFVQL